VFFPFPFLTSGNSPAGCRAWTTDGRPGRLSQVVLGEEEIVGEMVVAGSALLGVREAVYNCIIPITPDFCAVRSRSSSTRGLLISSRVRLGKRKSGMRCRPCVRGCLAPEGVGVACKSR